MQKLRRILAVLNLPAHVPDLIKLAHSIVQAMQANAATFVNPNPVLGSVIQHISELDAAETAAKSKAKGTAEIRDVKLAVVKADLDYLKSYVQQVADSKPTEAEVIIQSAGMSVRKPITRNKLDFEARHGDVSGVAVLLVRAAQGKVAYEWQISTDQKTWSPLPTTVLAKNVIQGLTPATTYSFRYRLITTAGQGEWSQAVTLLVT